MSNSEENPFEDPEVRGSSPVVSEVVLPVGHNASLALGKDSVTLLDEGLVGKDRFNCCGLVPSNRATRTIPFYNILWAEVTDIDITIHYARAASSTIVRPAFIHYTIEKTDRALADRWVGELLNRAYGLSQRRKRIKVLINPFGGKGNAQKIFTRDIEPIFAAARCEVDVERTQYAGHAIDIAEKIDTEAWDVIACCSGDGVCHEVWNGLGKRKDGARALQKLAVVMLPGGSGNALSACLTGTTFPSLVALSVVKGIRTPMDLASVTQGDRRTLSFLSQSVGIVAEADLATEHLRFLGDSRFTYGFLLRVIRKSRYPAEISMCLEEDSKPALKERYAAYAANETIDDRVLPNPDTSLPALQFGTVNDPLPSTWTPLAPYNTLGSFYAGNMSYMSTDANFFPAALPADGCLDLVTIDGDIKRRANIRLMLSVGEGKLFDQPEVRYRKVKGYRLIPKQVGNGYISVDGERIPFEPFQVEVHRGLCTVLSRTGHLYEAPGP